MSGYGADGFGSRRDRDADRYAGRPQSRKHDGSSARGSGEPVDGPDDTRSRGDLPRADRAARRQRDYGDGQRRTGSDDGGDKRRSGREQGGRPDARRRGQPHGAPRRGPARGDGRDRRDGRGGRNARSDDHRGARLEGPAIPDEITADELDASVRRDLHTLDRANAELVARHLVMAGRLVDDDPVVALEHARAARERAGRIAVVREAVGISAYHAGEWAEALSELRAARRMGGGPGLIAVMADCERGLGRPQKALELGRSDEARGLDADQARELRIVLAGARLDLGQPDAAVVTLQTDDLKTARPGPEHARLFYVYAEALLAADRRRDALEWFFKSASADTEGITDAEDRVAELADQDD